MLYRQIAHEMSARGILFAVGGSVAIATHTRNPRVSKDLDLYVLPADKDRAVAVLNDLGFSDYYDRLPYERHWIYRAIIHDEIVDVIWQMANRRAEVDERWLTEGPEVDLCGEGIKVVPMEELIWSKLYVLQRDRTDWPDILNLLHCCQRRIDWRILFWRAGEDRPLLYAVLEVFRWLQPEFDHYLPDWLRARMPIDGQDASKEPEPRAALLDSRNWLIPPPAEEGVECS